VRRIEIAVVLSMLLTVTGLQGCESAADSGPAWLVGDWHVTYNPLNDDTDVLKFMPKNKVAILAEDGRKMTGHYLIREDKLLLVIDKGGRSVETEFHISTARDRLTYKNGAYYTRTDNSNVAANAVSTVDDTNN